MILPKSSDALHKAWLYRLLIAIIDDRNICHKIFFKGGTCASMLNFLDRFSVDLDFDLEENVSKNELRGKLHTLFKGLNLTIRDESQKALQFFLKYPSQAGKRNTIKLDIIDNRLKSNTYAVQYLAEIDRQMNCQTIETMFAHKLAAVTDRFKKNKTICGRDIYDLHYFFLHDYRYNPEVIKERTGLTSKTYLAQLIQFITKKVSQTIIDEDLNALLTPEQFRSLRKTLKIEVLVMLRDELKGR